MILIFAVDEAQHRYWRTKIAQVYKLHPQALRYIREPQDLNGYNGQGVTLVLCGDWWEHDEAVNVIVYATQLGIQTVRQEDIL